MKMRKLSFLLLLFLSTLYASDNEIPGRLSADQQPQAVVAGCVNTVSGSFFFSETDLPAAGLGTLQLVRSYDSGNGGKGFFGKGMSHTFPTNLWIREKKDQIKAALSTSESSEIPYEGKAGGTFSIPFDFREESGYTGSINPLNRLEPHLGHIHISGGQGKWRARLSNGALRHFIHKKDRDNRLTLEELPNGQTFHYLYPSDSMSVFQKDADGSRLSSLFILNGDTKYASLDKQKYCTYHFDSRKRLKAVEAGHLPAQGYEYNRAGKLCKLWKGGSEQLKIEYFKTDKHHKGKVKNIQRPKRYGGHEKLYTFSYKKDQTIVTCPLGNAQIFNYHNRRITQFEDCAANRCWKYRYTPLADIRSLALFETSTNTCLHYISYTYDKNGNPLSKKTYGQITGNQDSAVAFPNQDQPHQETAFEYSEENRLTKEIKPNGTEIHYTYHPGTSLVQSKQIISQGVCQLREFYTYNSAGFTTEIIEDDGSGSEADDLTNATYRLKTVNTYEKLLPLSTSKLYQDPQTKEWILLSRKENHYDHLNRPIEQRTYDAGGSHAYSTHTEYDAHNNITSQINPLGELTLYTYDHLDRKTSEEHFGTGKITRFHYNRYNQLIKETEEHADGETLITTHTYDLAGNRKRTTDPYGNKTIFIYDQSSRLISTIDPSGNQETTTYDIFNHPIIATDKNGHQTHRSYNIFGQVLTTAHPDGTFTCNQYRLDSTLHIKTEADGSYTEYTYDYLDRVIKEEIFSPEGKSLAVSTKHYKGKNLIFEIDARGIKTTYTHDPAGRKTSMQRGSRLEEYSYDSLGRLYCTKTQDRIEIKEFDNLDRVIEERVEDRQKLLRKKTLAYDRFGNICLERQYTSLTEYSEIRTLYNSHNLIASTIDPQGNETTYHYLFDDQFTKIRIDPLGQEQWETFDWSGNCIRKEIRFFGNVYAGQRNHYDPVGNLIKQIHDIYIDTEKTGEYVIEWQYNEVGQVVKETEQNLKTTETYYFLGKKTCEIKPGGASLCYAYDHFGRVSELFSSDSTIHYQYRYDPVGNLTSSEDLVNQTLLEREYDENNNITKERLPNGYESRFDYDSQNRLTKIILPDLSEVHYIWNAADLIAVKRGDQEHRYTLDLAGNIIQETGFHGEVVDYTYDPNQRITSIVSKNFKQHLAFDAVGNLVEDNEEAYTYDFLYQLTSDQNTHYKYDSLNNRLEKDSLSYSHTPLQQVAFDGESEYAYDGDGNRIVKGNTCYQYDALNRLIEADGIRYSYDSFGRLMSRSNECFFYYKNYDLGNPDALRLIGRSTIGIETSQGLFSALCDYRGSVCVILDEALNKRAEYRYSAFGETEATGDFHSPWQFYSQRADAETGFLHF
ncbi:DUF6531 domain-containing protein [Waddlia chondrophila]|uniref:Putative rhs family protein n=2 Tax=Waddlia chondrophila TaxID=71667 RepID=D6YUF1_WADCW|nr:DUF6531 domain-containing protein [Waddlia chondrophila]ADI37762.1 putative rhs family protein [Waddlia chondrophila WSU 86-1044]